MGILFLVFSGFLASRHIERRKDPGTSGRRRAALGPTREIQNGGQQWKTQALQSFLRRTEKEGEILHSPTYKFRLRCCSSNLIEPFFAFLLSEKRARSADTRHERCSRHMQRKREIVRQRSLQRS